MAITYCEENRSFKLDTENTSYVIGIVDAENFVGHAYYGKKLGDDDVNYLLRTGEAPFTPEKTAGTGFHSSTAFHRNFLRAVLVTSGKAQLC